MKRQEPAARDAARADAIGIGISLLYEVIERVFGVSGEGADEILAFFQAHPPGFHCIGRLTGANVFAMRRRIDDHAQHAMLFEDSSDFGIDRLLLHRLNAVAEDEERRRGPRAALSDQSEAK